MLPPPTGEGSEEGGPWPRVEDLHLAKRGPIPLALYISKFGGGNLDNCIADYLLMEMRLLVKLNLNGDLDHLLVHSGWSCVR